MPYNSPPFLFGWHSYSLQAQHALGGNLERIKRVVRLGGFVNVTAGYTAIAPVMNGCSDFIVRLATFLLDCSQLTHVRRSKSWGRRAAMLALLLVQSAPNISFAHLSQFHFIPGVFELPLGAVVEV
jgi:hypothetical protein